VDFSSDVSKIVIGAQLGYIGSLISPVLTSRKEHLQWIRERKMEEYRDLIDTLRTSIEKIYKARPNVAAMDRKAISDAVYLFSRVIYNRLFVAKEVGRKHLQEEWEKIVQLVYWEPGDVHAESGNVVYSVTALSQLATGLERRVVEMAHRDLRI